MTNDLTAEEKALLAATEPEEKGPRRRKAAVAKEDGSVTPAAQALARGTYTPVQYDDDGWGDLPVQMRG